MAFGDNPANAVDPDGGTWEWRPLAIQFLFCIYWGAFWAIAESMGGESNLASIKASIVVAMGRQVARYGQELTTLAMSRTEILTHGNKRILVVASPELYERAPSGRLVIVGSAKNIAIAFATELIENGVFAGVPLTAFYRENPAAAMFLGLVVIGVVNVAATAVGLQCCGERGQVWRIRASYPLTNADANGNIREENPERALWSYKLRSFRFDYGWTDTIGQGVFRVGFTAIAPGFGDSFNDAFVVTGGWVARNVAGRGLTAVLNLAYGRHTPVEGQIVGLFLAFDNGQLITSSVSVHTFSPYGERGPITISMSELQSYSSDQQSLYKGWYGTLFDGHNTIIQRFDEIAVATRLRGASDSVAHVFRGLSSTSNVRANGSNNNEEDQKLSDDDHL
jgi:hypothetical protein